MSRPTSQFTALPCDSSVDTCGVRFIRRKSDRPIAVSRRRRVTGCLTPVGCVVCLCLSLCPLTPPSCSWQVCSGPASGGQGCIFYRLSSCKLPKAHVACMRQAGHMRAFGADKPNIRPSPDVGGVPCAAPHITRVSLRSRRANNHNMGFPPPISRLRRCTTCVYSDSRLPMPGMVAHGQPYGEN